MRNEFEGIICVHLPNRYVARGDKSGSVQTARTFRRLGRVRRSSPNAAVAHARGERGREREGGGGGICASEVRVYGPDVRTTRPAEPTALMIEIGLGVWSRCRGACVRIGFVFWREGT